MVREKYVLSGKVGNLPALLAWTQWEGMWMWAAARGRDYVLQYSTRVHKTRFRNSTRVQQGLAVAAVCCCWLVVQEEGSLA